MMRMLVVDDDPAWRSLYRMGFEETSKSSRRWTGSTRWRPSTGCGRISSLDLRMPHLDGMGFLRQMERRGLKVPVVVCSGTFTMDSPPSFRACFRLRRVPTSTTPGAPSKLLCPDPPRRTRISEVSVARSKRPSGAIDAVIASSRPLPSAEAVFSICLPNRAHVCLDPSRCHLAKHVIFHALME